MMTLELKNLPALIIGSIVKVWPAFITPTALFPDQAKVTRRRLTELRPIFT